MPISLNWNWPHWTGFKYKLQRDYQHPNLFDMNHRLLPTSVWYPLYHAVRDRMMEEELEGLLRVIETLPNGVPLDQVGYEPVLVLFVWSHVLDQPVLLYAVPWLQCDKKLVKDVIRFTY